MNSLNCSALKTSYEWVKLVGNGALIAPDLRVGNGQHDMGWNRLLGAVLCLE